MASEDVFSPFGEADDVNVNVQERVKLLDTHITPLCVWMCEAPSEQGLGFSDTERNGATVCAPHFIHYIAYIILLFIVGCKLDPRPQLSSSVEVSLSKTPHPKCS